jgi:thiamine transporter ThiT
MEGLKTCMRYIFILSAMIIAGVFATDWWFTRDGDLLNDTLVGVMIGAPIGWFGAFVAFYTTEKISQMTKQENDDARDSAPPSADH